MKAIKDLSNELLYRIIEDYDDIKENSNTIYEYKKFINKRKNLYRLFRLQIPKSLYKKYFHLIIYEMYYLDCSYCEEFIPFEKKVDILNKYDEKVYKNVKLCSSCYIEVTRQSKNKKVKRFVYDYYFEYISSNFSYLV